MDNVLIQVTGRKRVVLFPPSDIDYMYMQGDKSQVIDIDEPNYDTYPLFAHVTRYECELVAGDCLFIPGTLSLLFVFVHFLMKLSVQNLGGISNKKKPQHSGSIT